LSGQAKLKSNDELLFQLVGGRAVARYVSALAGTGNDAVYDPVRNEFETLPVAGWELSYGHPWKSGLKSYASAGVVRLFNRDFQPADALKRSEYFSANLMWDEVEGLRTGLEYSWGRRVNKGGDDGTANRISFSVYYDF
jgi:hypothetical protein